MTNEEKLRRIRELATTFPSDQAQTGAGMCYCILEILDSPLRENGCAYCGGTLPNNRTVCYHCKHDGDAKCICVHPSWHPLEEPVAEQTEWESLGYRVDTYLADGTQLPSIGGIIMTREEAEAVCNLALSRVNLRVVEIGRRVVK